MTQPNIAAKIKTQTGSKLETILIRYQMHLSDSQIVAYFTSHYILNLQ
jgi:hypothetical protein